MGLRRHLGCQDGTHETDHLLSEHLTLITPPRAVEDLSIKGNRTCNSQIPLKGHPEPFYQHPLTTNIVNASVSPFSSVSRKYQNKLQRTKLSTYKKTLDIFRCSRYCGRPSARWGHCAARVTTDGGRFGWKTGADPGGPATL